MAPFKAVGKDPMGSAIWIVMGMGMGIGMGIGIGVLGLDVAYRIGTLNRMGGWASSRSCSGGILCGRVQVPKQPGRGVALDMAEVEKVHQLQTQHGLGWRDDAMAMKYLVPGWAFNPARPPLDR